MTTVELLCAFFGWGAILNFVLLTLFFLFWVGARDFVVRLHGRWFKMPPESIDAILYAIMAAMKIATWMFFVVPWAVLRFIV